MSTIQKETATDKQDYIAVQHDQWVFESVRQKQLQRQVQNAEPHPKTSRVVKAAKMVRKSA